MGSSTAAETGVPERRDTGIKAAADTLELDPTDAEREKQQGPGASERTEWDGCTRAFLCRRSSACVKQRIISQTTRGSGGRREAGEHETAHGPWPGVSQAGWGRRVSMPAAGVTD